MTGGKHEPGKHTSARSQNRTPDTRNYGGKHEGGGCWPFLLMLPVTLPYYYVKGLLTK